MLWQITGAAIFLFLVAVMLIDATNDWPPEAR